MNNGEMHDKSSLQDADTVDNKWPWLPNLKAFLGHAGLCLTLVAYTVVGGVVSYERFLLNLIIDKFIGPTS